MKSSELLSPWIRRFLLEELVTQRNLSVNTQQSYRDTFKLLLPFVAEDLHCSIDQLKTESVSKKKIEVFWNHSKKNVIVLSKLVISG